MNLSKDVKVTLVQPPLAVGQAATNSSSVDMTGFDGVMFIGIIGTVSGVGTVVLKAAQSSNDSDFDDLVGITQSITPGADDKFLLLDVYKPLDQYVRTTLTRAVDNSIYGGTIAIQYGAHKKPTVHDASTLAAAAILGVSPSE